MVRRLIAMAVLASGCTFANPIDVCERAQSAEVQVNRSRTEGDQRVGAVAPMPAGGALVVFRSAASASPDDARTSIAGALVDPEGNPLATCGDDNERTYVAASGALGDVQLRTNPALAPPADANEDAFGLLAWVEDHDDTVQVRAVGLGVDGCPLGALLPDDPPRTFEVASAAPGCRLLRHPEAVEYTCATSTSVVRLGPRRFAVTWEQFDGSDLDVYASVIDVDFLGLTARATVVPPGEPLLDARPAAYTTIALDGGRFLLLWLDRGLEGISILARIHDDALGPFPPPPALRLHQAPGTEPPAGTPRMGAARLGDRILLVWTQREGGETSRVFGLFLGPDGAVLAGPEGAQAFRISDGVDGEETEPSVTMFEGGFLVSWVVLDSATAGDGSGSSARAILLDAQGERRFVNPACDRASFQLNQGADGDQRWPALATLAGGQVLSVWTDEGVNGADMSGSSVAASILDRRALLPIP